MLFSPTALSFIAVGSNLSGSGFHGMHTLKTLTSASSFSTDKQKDLGGSLQRNTPWESLEDILCGGTVCLCQCEDAAEQSSQGGSLH